MKAFSIPNPKWALGLVLAVCGVAFFLGHYVQDYSDPVGFLSRAIVGGGGFDPADRAPIYPFLLYWIMAAVGRDWVFISNIPFILALAYMLYRMTCLALTMDSRPRGRLNPAVGWAGIFSIIWLFAVRRSVLLQLVNPYREPLTFFLVFLSILWMWKGWGRQAMGYVFGSGFILGLATSIRETAIFIALPMVVWISIQMLRERRLYLKGWIFLILGGLLGLSPILYKNVRYSGNVLIPAYSANRVSDYSQTGEWDIPVPGMSLKYFASTGSRTLNETVGAYSWTGLLLFVLGLGLAVRRKNAFVLGLLFPSVLVYFSFYAFYIKYMARYLLAGEVFLIPIMVYGATGCCSGLIKGLGQFGMRIPDKVLKAALWCGVLAFSGWMLAWVIRDEGNYKVWNLATVRKELSEHLETPAVFLGHRHFAFRLEWILDQKPYEYERYFHMQRHAKKQSLEQRLSRQGRQTLKRFSKGNYYINQSSFALAENWLKREFVMDLDELTIPLLRYGLPEGGPLYKVVPWETKELILLQPEPRPDTALLMMDMKRPWDYPGRTFLTGVEKGVEGLRNGISITNGVQFVELPAGTPAEEGFEFHLQSDAPLPPSIYWSLLSLNDEIVLPYGIAMKAWAWEYVSESLYPGGLIPRDGCYLFDSGKLWLPTFAEKGMNVSAEIRLEFIQDHPFWQEKRSWIEVESPVDTVRASLPPRRTQKKVYVSLGQGTGGLKMVPVLLRSSLPSYQEQNSFTFRADVGNKGFIKIFDTRILTAEIPDTYPVVVDIGGKMDVPFLVEGFHGTERSGEYTGRWTEETGRLRIALPETPDPLDVSWSVLPHRPDLDRIQPVFVVNGQEIPHHEVRSETSAPPYVYTFTVSAKDLKPQAPNEFSIQTPPWVPADSLNSSDTRTLGVFVEKVEVSVSRNRTEQPADTMNQSIPADL